VKHLSAKLCRLGAIELLGFDTSQLLMAATPCPARRDPWEARKHHQDRKTHNRTLREEAWNSSKLQTLLHGQCLGSKIEDRLAHACSVGQFMGLNTVVSMVWIVLLWVPHGSQTKRETKKHGKQTKETIKDLVLFSH